MTTRTLGIFGSLFGIVGLAALPTTGGCTPTVRDFGTGGAGSTGTTTSSAGGAAGSGGSGGAAGCTPGAQAACYGGPSGTQDVGTCRAGLKVCNKAGDGYGPCAGDVLPAPEDCATPADESCDGTPGPCALTALWAKANGLAGNNNVVRGVAVGAMGAIVVTGTFDGTVAFDSADAAGITSQGGDDIFVAKYSPDGTLQWVKTYGNSERQEGAAVAIGNDGRIYVVGNFEGKVDFGNFNNLVSDSASRDIFVLELDPLGNTNHAIAAGDAQDQRAIAVGLTSTGEVIVGGNFSGLMTFPGGPTLLADINQKMFVTRLTPSLKHLESKQSEGAGFQALSAIAIGPNDQVAFTGTFENDLSFKMNPVTLNSVDGRDIVVGQLDGVSLNPMWGRAYNGASEDRGAGIAVDPQGNVVLGGYFGKQMMIDQLSLVSPGEASLFLAKLTPTGKGIWANAFGGSVPGFDLPVPVATNQVGDIFVGGSYYLTADFGGGVLTAIGMPNDFGALDTFVAVLDQTGKYVAAKSFGNQTIQAGFSIALDNQGDFVFGGATAGQLDFGTGPVGSPDLLVVSPFLVKFHP